MVRRVLPETGDVRPDFFTGFYSGSDPASNSFNFRRSSLIWFEKIKRLLLEAHLLMIKLVTDASVKITVDREAIFTFVEED